MALGEEQGERIRIPGQDGRQGRPAAGDQSGLGRMGRMVSQEVRQRAIGIGHRRLDRMALEPLGDSRAGGRRNRAQGGGDIAGGDRLQRRIGCIHAGVVGRTPDELMDQIQPRRPRVPRSPAAENPFRPGDDLAGGVQPENIAGLALGLVLGEPRLDPAGGEHGAGCREARDTDRAKAAVRFSDGGAQGLQAGIQDRHGVDTQVQAQRRPDLAVAVADAVQQPERRPEAEPGLGHSGVPVRAAHLNVGVAVEAEALGGRHRRRGRLRLHQAIPALVARHPGADAGRLLPKLELAAAIQRQGCPDR
jgi:hypothetical protein